MQRKEWKQLKMAEEDEKTQLKEFFFMHPSLKYAESDLISTMSWNSWESYGGKVAGV